VRLPGSKSISNRMLLLAALAHGQTRLTGVLDSDDTQVMIEALRRLGVSVLVTPAEQGIGLDCTIEGVAGVFPKVGSPDEPINLFVGNSGLSIRTLLPALVASFSVSGGCAHLSGVPRMHERPIGDLVDGLRAIGADISYVDREGFPPLRVVGRPLAVQKEIWVKGSTSSQFLTGLLQAAPLLAGTWHQPVSLCVEGGLISRPYIDITRAVLRQFGVSVEEIENPNAAVGHDLKYQVMPQRIMAPRFAPSGAASSNETKSLSVEGDASSASYFLAAGLLGGGPVRVLGAGRNSVQGDIRFAEALKEMGAEIAWGPDWIEASGGQVRAADLYCNDIPDAAMTLAVVALFADGPTTLRGIGSWRVKETDRIAAMATECRKFGATVEVGEDWMRIEPVFRQAARPIEQSSDASPVRIETYDDHRVAMCFSLASFGHRPVRLDDPGCVAKTFPDYFEHFSDLCSQAVPIITIDGPTASGKGTIAGRLADALGFRYLDSGALYRLSALAAQNAAVDIDSEQAVTSIATQMDIEFTEEKVFLDGNDVTDAIRQESVGLLASKIAVYPALRRALLLRQRDFGRLPGLVADGRDMGTVVFPHAGLKVFLTATPRARAERRYKQLIAKGFSCNLDSLSADLKARDARDLARPVAPLKPASGALVVDSTRLSVDQVVQSVLNAWHSQKPHTPF